MKNILILGSTGHLGKVLVNVCLKNNFNVTVLVRNKNKLNLINENLRITEGQVTERNDLLKSLNNIDVVISTLGHGFRTRFPIQVETMKILIPLMKEKNIKRLITITGAGLKINGDPKSFIAEFSEKIFTVVDPYRISDAKNQQELIEKSNIDWTTIRTPIHTNNKIQKIKYVGFNQPQIWSKLSRNAISEFVIDCIENNKWIKKSPIIY